MALSKSSKILVSDINTALSNKQDKLSYTPVKSVNGTTADSSGNVTISVSAPVTSVNGMTGAVTIDVVATKVNQAGWADSTWSAQVTPNCGTQNNVGQGSSGKSVYLPAGGTWAWIGGGSSTIAGVSAGGSAILQGDRDNPAHAFYIRIS